FRFGPRRLACGGRAASALRGGDGGASGGAARCRDRSRRWRGGGGWRWLSRGDPQSWGGPGQPWRGPGGGGGGGGGPPPPVGGPALQYVEGGFAQLKGIAEPVRVLAICPAEAPHARTPTVDGAGEGETATSPIEASKVPLPIGGFLGALPDGPLVARARETARIAAALDTVTAGTGQLILLAGEPGAGKTRLAQE